MIFRYFKRQITKDQMLTSSNTHVFNFQAKSPIQNKNTLEMTEGVQGFLGELGLLQYYDMFVIKGFDSEDDLCYLDGKDLDAMYITDPDHRKQILCSASDFRPSEQYKVLDWLKQNGLEHYFQSFVEGDYTSLDEIEKLNLPDEEVYDELEITLPGHKRRLERAVNRLRKRHRPLLPAKTEVPVAFGRWGKPACLEDAKFDFLILDATVISTNNPVKFHTFEFMIDSGSDVVTMQEEVLKTLDLELLGQIHSKGVHGSKKTNLYKATLRIGTQEMEIEVMGETYNSLGSRVVRHFRHYLDGSRHVWLKGNYRDPGTNIREASSDLKALLPPETSSNSPFSPISISAITETSSDQTVLSPPDTSSNISFLPISRAPVTVTSSECLRKPTPLPAKTVSIDSDHSKLEKCNSDVTLLSKQDPIEIIGEDNPS
ncbi:uncharacterized protein [Mytilus edulis]|uniref:uncharacterized protein n=1 Tax=Mytilus edulis TaxID=6550 RepID=UPI0039F08A12